MNFPQIKVNLLLFCLLFSGFLTAQQQPISTIASTVFVNRALNAEKNMTKDSLRYKTLFDALKISEMDVLLKDSGSFTIFAPSETAFSELTPSKIRELFESDDKKLLNYLLASHIVPGKLTASKILRAMCKGSGRAVFTTIQGNKLIATMSGIDIILTDSTGNRTTITRADLDRENTLIHEIDSVMVASNL